MKLGAAGATLDIDVRHGQIATGGAAGLGDRDPARVLAAAIVGGVQERDALRGRRVGRIADQIGGAREIDGEHRRAGVDVADELTLRAARARRRAVARPRPARAVRRPRARTARRGARSPWVCGAGAWDGEHVERAASRNARGRRFRPPISDMLVVRRNRLMTLDVKRYPILVVDDEQDNLDAFRFNFRKTFDILTATSGRRGAPDPRREAGRGRRHRPAHAEDDRRRAAARGPRAHAGNRRHHLDRVHRRRRADRGHQPRPGLSLHHQAVGRQRSARRAAVRDRALSPAAREQAAIARSSPSTPAT